VEEETVPPPHEKIRIFAGQGLEEAVMAGHVEGLREICRRRDLAGLILTLKEMIPDYNPSKELLGRALESAAGGKRVGAVG